MKNYYIGIDLGGTNIKAALVNTLTGEISETTSIPTQSREGYDAVIANMGKLVESIVAASGITPENIGGIGIGVPGEIDMERGITLFLTNLPGQWRNVALAEKLQALTGFNVSLINDACDDFCGVEIRRWQGRRDCCFLYAWHRDWRRANHQQ